MPAAHVSHRSSLSFIGLSVDVTTMVAATAATTHPQAHPQDATTAAQFAWRGLRPPPCTADACLQRANFDRGTNSRSVARSAPTSDPAEQLCRPATAKASAAARDRRAAATRVPEPRAPARSRALLLARALRTLSVEGPTNTAALLEPAGTKRSLVCPFFD